MHLRDAPGNLPSHVPGLSPCTEKQTATGRAQTAHGPIPHDHACPQKGLCVQWVFHLLPCCVKSNSHPLVLHHWRLPPMRRREDHSIMCFRKATQPTSLLEHGRMRGGEAGARLRCLSLWDALLSCRCIRILPLSKRDTNSACGRLRRSRLEGLRVWGGSFHHLWTTSTYSACVDLDAAKDP